MKRWSALCLEKNEDRWVAFSEELNKAGFANEYVPWTGPLDQIKDLSAFDGLDHLRFCADVGLRIIPHLKVQSSRITLIGVVDGMVKQEHGWWPLCAVHDALGEILIQLGHEVDKRGYVFIAGVNGNARASIAAFFKCGFRKFMFTHDDEGEAQALLKELNRRFFGLEIQWVPMDRIVVLPGETTVLVNCKPGPDDDPLLTELSYLNFLRRPGFIFDLSGNRPDSLLLREGKDANARVLSSLDVAKYQDALWTKWAFQKSQL